MATPVPAVQNGVHGTITNGVFTPYQFGDTSGYAPSQTGTFDPNDQAGQANFFATHPSGQYGLALNAAGQQTMIELNPGGTAGAGAFGGSPRPTSAAGQPVAASQGTPEQQGARAALNATLAQYGLGQLGDSVWQQYLAGKPIDQILLDIRNTPDYKARFPGMEALAQKGQAISESQYINYETGVQKAMQEAGLPAGFYDTRSDIANFLVNDVSIPEIQRRVALASQAAFTAPPELRAALQRDYGLDSGQLTAYFLDPSKSLPIIQQQYLAGEIGGASTRTGYGATTRAENEQLAAQGVTGAQAQQGFSQLGRESQLFNGLPGSNEDSISRDDQLAAQFSGNADAQMRIQNRAAQRVAEFGGGGGFAASATGVEGLGVTPDR